MPSSLTCTLVTLATLAINLAFAAPTPWDKDIVEHDGYSGAAGNSSGGSFEDNGNDGSILEKIVPPLINVESENGGNGGQADSGNAVVGSGSEPLHGTGKFPQTKSGKAFTGVGGNASGGTVTGKPGIINLFSDNAGDAGRANSGSSFVDSGLPLAF